MNISFLTTNIFDQHLGGKRRVPACVWVSGDDRYVDGDGFMSLSPSITAKQEQLDL